jgi:monoamine oxidase
MKHDWPSGCTYWLPGDYDVKQASKAALNPAPNLYIAGESISLNQTWMEGALESAEILLKKISHTT